MEAMDAESAKDLAEISDQYPNPGDELAGDDDNGEVPGDNDEEFEQDDDEHF